MSPFRNILKLPTVRRFSQLPQQETLLEYLSGSDTGIAVFALNRPKQQNALSANLLHEIETGIHRINFDAKARVLLLRSLVPGVFCAGADLKERLTMPQSEIPQFVGRLRQLMSRIQKIPIPVIAAIDGVALGGGLEMALACDIRTASDDARMGLVETRLAVIPGAGGTQRLPRLINTAIAKELIYTAKVISGARAEELGIVNHSVPQNTDRDAAFIEALELGRSIVENGPVAVRLAKRAIDKGLEGGLDDGMLVEEECYAHIVPTRDRVEGLQAFKEKRKPNYTGQ